MDIPIDTVLETNRCRLRVPREGDVPHVFSAAQHSGFTDGMQWSPPETEEELLPNVQKCISTWEIGEEFSWTIERRENRTFLGRISIRREQGDDVWSIGFWLHPDHWGKGYMTEAAQKIIEWGFLTLNASKITTAHATWNEASRKVMERLEFHHTGHNPCGFEKDGKCVPEEEYEISQKEWRERENLEI